MKTLLRALVVGAIGLVAAGAEAQTIDCPEWNALIGALVSGADPRAATVLTDVGQNTSCYAAFLSDATRSQRSAFADAIRRFEAARSDRQAGASAVGSGSTSVVSQGPVAKVLSVAAEYGALTQSATNGVVTVRGNLAGVPSALVSHDIFPYCPGLPNSSDFCVNHSILSLLRQVSFGISFDPSRTQTLAATPAAVLPSDAQAVTFSGSQREITGFSVRIELVNHRDATSSDFRDAWAERVGKSLDQVTDALSQAGNVIVDVTMLPGYDRWRADAQLAVQSEGRDRARIEGAFRTALDRLTVLVKSVPDVEAKLAELQHSYSRFFLAQDDLIDSLAEKPVLAFEYAQNRPLAQPTMSNYRAILDYPLSRTTKVVANAALTAYDSAPSDPAAGGRLRDAQAGVQLDKGLGDTAIGPAVFSLAGYFQYQKAAAILIVDPATPLPGVSFTGLPDGANKVFTKTGNIWLAQAKLSLTPSESSVTIPVSVTWSNRTELIDKPAWRAQVGISYNIDALLAAANNR
jgi:hypothetical protein